MRKLLVSFFAYVVTAVVLASSASATEAKNDGVLVVDWASDGVTLPTTPTQKKRQQQSYRHGEPSSLVSHWLDSALGSSSQEDEDTSFSSSSSIASRRRHERGNSSRPSDGKGKGKHHPDDDGGGSGDDSGDDSGHHKPLLPLGPRDSLGLVAAALAILLASGSGIGGGGLLVPIFLLVLGFGTRDAVALSNLTILGSSAVSLFFNLPRRHPRHADRPLIDWDIILVMEPSTICGAVAGGYLNKITPTWLTTTLLALVLTAMAWKLTRRARSFWELEGEERRLARLAAERGEERIRGLSALLLHEEEAVFGTAALESSAEDDEPLLPGQTLSSAPSLPSLVSLADEAAAAAARSPTKPKPPHSRRRVAGGFGENGGNGASPSSSSPPKPALARGEDEERPSASSPPLSGGGETTTAAATAAAASAETPSHFSEPRVAPPGKVALIVALTLFVLAADLAKQLVPCGSLTYWLAVASVIPPSLAVALAARARLVREHALREGGLEPGWPPYEPGEVVWTSANSVAFPAVSTLAGVVAGFFGVGGGIVKGPLMLEMGVAPEVAAATSITMILFTSSAASVLYVSFGVPTDYAKVVFLTGAVFTALGQSVVARLIRKLGKGGNAGGGSGGVGGAGAGVVVVAMALMMGASASVVTFEAGALARRAYLSGSLGGHGHIC